MNESRFNKFFNYFIFIGMFLSVSVACWFNIKNSQSDIALQLIVAFGSMMGVTSTVLAAQGNILNFVIGGLGAVIETYVFYKTGVTSMLLLYLFYFIPMDFIGFFNWKKRGASTKSEIKARRLKPVQWLYVVLGYIAVAVAAFGVSYFAATHNLSTDVSMNYPKLVADALTTSATIVAIVLMSMAYMDQWYIWTLVNLSSIVLWSITIATTPGSAYTVVMLIKYIFYFLNGINAIRIWKQLSKE